MDIVLNWFLSVLHVLSIGGHIFIFGGHGIAIVAQHLFLFELLVHAMSLSLSIVQLQVLDILV